MSRVDDVRRQGRCGGRSECATPLGEGVRVRERDARPVGHVCRCIGSMRNAGSCPETEQPTRLEGNDVLHP